MTMDALTQLIAEREEFISLARIMKSLIEENVEAMERARGTTAIGVALFNDLTDQIRDAEAVLVRARKQLVSFPS